MIEPNGNIERFTRIFVAQLQELHETQADVSQVPMKELHSQTFYRSTNTLIVRHRLTYTCNNIHMRVSCIICMVLTHKVEGFLELARMGGHGSLSNTSSLLSATACLPEAGVLHRNSTYNQLLWSTLKARSVLLSLLHKDNEREAALRHCQQLSALIAHRGLETSPELRALQMQVH